MLLEAQPQPAHGPVPTSDAHCARGSRRSRSPGVDCSAEYSRQFVRMPDEFEPDLLDAAVRHPGFRQSEADAADHATWTEYRRGDASRIRQLFAFADGVAARANRLKFSRKLVEPGRTLTGHRRRQRCGKRRGHFVGLQERKNRFAGRAPDERQWLMQFDLIAHSICMPSARAANETAC